MLMDNKIGFENQNTLTLGSLGDIFDSIAIRRHSSVRYFLLHVMSVKRITDGPLDV